MSPLTTYLIETAVTLLAVVALAVLILWGARRIGAGRPAGPLELIGRLPLEGRRSVYLVRVAESVFVLGASEAGLVKLGELPSEGLGAPRTSVSAPPKFSAALASALLGRRPPGRPESREPGGEESDAP
jgi:flagellar biogenesis protein FliO